MRSTMNRRSWLALSALFANNPAVEPTRMASYVITGIGYQFADGQKIIRLERVVLADGKKLRVYGR